MLLKPRFHPQKLVRLPEREDMTLCIAAFATKIFKEEKNQTDVVLCSDLRIETTTSSSEIGFKMKKLGKHWAAMVAGNVSKFEELITMYCAHLPREVIPETEILDILRIPPQKFKRRLAEEYVQTMLAIPYDEFIKDGSKNLPSSLFENIMSDIARIQLDCQLILIPINGQKSSTFYCVESNGSVFQQDHFCAIGSGANSANSWLHFREHSRFDNLDLTLCSVLEARRFSANAPGVGKKTHVSLITHDGKLLLTRSDNSMAADIWKRTGPRDNKKVRFDVPKLFGTPLLWDDVGLG